MIRSIEGPGVLAAHSYGGAVISNVDRDAGNITGLTYLNSFAPDAGETAFQLAGMFPGSTLGDTVQTVPLSDGTTDSTSGRPASMPSLRRRVGGAVTAALPHHS
jgi:hypothetical protein